MRTLKLISLLTVLFLAAGCPGKGAEKKDDQQQGAATEPPFKVYRSGMPKYDRYFERSHKLRSDLWKADTSLAAIPGTIASALKMPGDIKKIGFGKVLEVLGKKYANKFLWKAGAGLQLKGDSDPDTENVLTTVKSAIKTLKGVPEGLGGAVSESKNLVTQGASLTKSAPKDFTGFNAVKLPAVTAKLAESGKELGGVPGQVAKIGGTSASMLKQLIAVFKPKK